MIDGVWKATGLVAHISILHGEHLLRVRELRGGGGIELARIGHVGGWVHHGS